MWSPISSQTSNAVLIRRWSAQLPWSGVLLALLLGVATRDCILIASAAVLAVYIARMHVEHGEARDLFRCAIHCWVVGGASLLAAIALVFWVSAMHAGLWDGNDIGTPSMLGILGFCVLTVGVTTAKTIHTSRRKTEFASFIAFGVAMVLTAFAARALDASGPCVFALSVAAVVALSGWQLARKIGAELARSSVRI
jgi:hypothetical protein